MNCLSSAKQRIDQALARIIVILMLFAFIGLSFILQPSKIFTIDVGNAGDGFFLRGFFPAEQTANGTTFRWSSANSAFLIPDPLVAYTLSIRLHTDIERFTATNESILTLQSANSQIVQVALQPGWRIYQILQRPGPQSTLHLQPIALSVVLNEQGARALGVAIDQVSARPINDPILATILIVLILFWWFILLLWATNIVLSTLQSLSQRVRMITQSLFAILFATGMMLWAWIDPFILIWILALHPAYLIICTITLVFISTISRVRSNSQPNNALS